MTPRQEEQSIIKEFGKEMQGKLDFHSDKGRLGWRDKDIEIMVKWLDNEVKELNDALSESPENLRKECADVANVAMMIWDSTNK